MIAPDKKPAPPEAPMPRAVIDALPNPLIVIDANERICLANVAAENYFQASSNVLVRHKLSDIVPFSSPVFGAVSQARAMSGVVNEYAIAVGTPRLGGERLVDVQTAVMAEQPGYVLVMLLERSMAHKIDRQLTSRGAARSVSGMASMLAHEIKNPLAGIGGPRNCWSPIFPTRTGRWRGSSATRPTASAIWSTRWKCSRTSGRSTRSRSTSMPCWNG